MFSESKRNPGNYYVSGFLIGAREAKMKILLLSGI